MPRQWSYEALVRQADPDFDTRKKKEVSYSFTNGLIRRTFYEDPAKSGAYTPYALADGGLIDDEGRQLIASDGTPLIED